MNQVKTLIIKFEGELKNHEIPQFRGAVISAVGGDILFHNHDGDGYRYSYPLIQYKKIGGSPSIVCVGQGVENIGKLFESGNFTFQIGTDIRQMDILSVKANKINVQLWESTFRYSLKKWLPLNPDNYRTYNALTSLDDKRHLLENILRGNILSFLKGIGIFLDGELKCTITELSTPYVLKYKGVGMTTFDAVFSTNLSIPTFIGIGKNAALGFGTVKGISHQI